MKTPPRISSTLVLALTFLFIGLGLLDGLARQNRKGWPTPRAQPKPAPASTPKKSSNKTALASNADFDLPKSGTTVSPVTESRDLLRECAMEEVDSY